MPDLSPHSYVLLFFAGIAAGIINTVAGGGSVITLPVLIFAGLPPAVANATNRLGLISQNFTAIWQFRKNNVRETHLSWRLTAVAAVGAILGAKMAVLIPDRSFNKVLGVLMLGLLVMILKQPKPKLVDQAPENAWSPLSRLHRAGLLVAFFALGVYAGFIQAGMGVMVLLVLGYFLRMDLVRGNYIKLVVILGLTFVALGTFISSGVKIAWFAGLATSTGQSIGAYCGSWVAIKKGEAWIKALMVTAIVLSSAKLLGLVDWVLGLF
ncbi:MAG: uncharacterized protein PWP23_2759 [Candidatus Sumerlaeota bacterium]|nr:uncharacterized protein [Candidatus Sumerlaeota bacterium]